MAPTRTKQRTGELERTRFIIDHHYTVDELEWNRIVGASGVGSRLLDAMADLSGDHFEFGDVHRVPMADSERFEFQIDGESYAIEFEYDVSPTSTLLQGLRQLFVDVNSALRRAGVDWRFVLTRRAHGSSRAFNYGLVLAPRTEAVDQIRDMDVVAGLDLREFEFTH